MTDATLPGRITGHTCKGFDNCFSLDGVRIVNAYLEDFQPLGLRDVKVRTIADRIGLIVDERVPPAILHNDRWCTVCTPFALLPADQQRNFLRVWEPHFRDGKLFSWGATLGSAHITHTDQQIDGWLTQLREVGAA